MERSSWTGAAGEADEVECPPPTRVQDACKAVGKSLQLTILKTELGSAPKMGGGMMVTPVSSTFNFSYGNMCTMEVLLDDGRRVVVLSIPWNKLPRSVQVGFKRNATTFTPPWPPTIGEAMSPPIT